MVARDTLTILGFALLAVVLGNLAGLGGPVGDLSSPTPEDSSTIIGGGSLPPRPTFPPIDTLGPIVNPTVGFQATPTPIPIITLGPPTQSPSPSVAPSRKPTPKPPPTPTPTPTPTLPPIPSAAFTCAVNGLALSCSVDSQAGATSWSWDWGDGSALDIGPTAQHTYPGPSTYLVKLTASGPGGTSYGLVSYTVTEPTPSP